jgi:hypothetical protein
VLALGLGYLYGLAKQGAKERADAAKKLSLESSVVFVASFLIQGV